MKKEVKKEITIMTEVGSKAEIVQVMVTDSKGHLVKVDLSMETNSEKKNSGQETSEEELISDEETGELQEQQHI